MKSIKRLLLTFVILLVVIVGAIALVPILFKDELVATLKQEINARVDGEVDFSDISLSWWSSFPMMDLTIHDLHVDGYKVDTAQADLLRAKAVHLSVDPIELWRNADEVRIKGFTLDEADVYIDQRTPRSNFDIMKPTDDATTAAPSSGQQMAFHLERYAIEQSRITYVNHEGGQVSKIKDIDHSGRLSYLPTGDILWTGDLASTGTTFKDGSVAYLSDATLGYKGEVHITEEMTRYTIEDNELNINDLGLSLDGHVQQDGEDYVLDLRTETSQPSFKSLLSLVPAIYAQDYKGMIADGSMSVAGTIKGRYAADGSSYPVYDIAAEVVDGAFQLPDLPKGVKDVQLKARLVNTARDLMPQRVDVPGFAMKFDDQPITGRVLLEDLQGDQRFDGALEGHVDLAMLSAAYPLPSVEELSGKLDIDMEAKGVIAQLVDEKYEDLTLDGTLDGQAIHVKMPDQPAIDLPVIKAHLEDAGLELDAFELAQGDSRLSGTGRIHPILPVPDATYTVSADVNSAKFDLRPWMSSDEATNATDPSDDMPSAQTESTLPKVRLDIKAACDELLYEDYDLTDIRVALKGSLEDMRLDNSALRLNGDLIEADGRIRGTEDYLNALRPLDGELNVKADRLDLNRLMGIENQGATSAEGGTSEDTEYPILPEDINMKVNLSAGQLLYDVYDFRKLKGAVHIADQQLVVSDATAQTMGGTVGLKALYAHDGTAAPHFAFTPRTQGVSIAQMIEKSGTLQFILPFLKYMDGELNTEMDLSGLLGDGYLPDLSTITGNGLIETLHSSIKGSNTLNEISQALRINELSEIAIDKSRNRFEIKEGKVFVKPFTQTVEDMHATIEGYHGLDGKMDYAMKLVVPTEKFEKAGVPSVITNNLGEAAAKLSQLGINVGDTESIALDIKINGDMTQPKVKVGVADVSTADVKELVKETVNEVVNEAVDSAKTVAKDEILNVIKKSNGDTTSTSITEAAGKEVKDRLGKDGRAILDSLGGSGLLGDTSGILGGAGKDLLDGLNPFGKKKKKKKKK